MNAGPATDASRAAHSGRVRPRAASRVAVPLSWGNASAAIVSALGTPQLPRLLVDAAAVLVPFEYCVMFVYRGRANPIRIYDSLPVPLSRAGLDNYTRSTYVLNPFYAAYLAGLRSGVYRMHDLAPDAFFEQEAIGGVQAHRTASEEIGYLTDGWPAGREELCIALTLPHGECAEMALSQPVARGGFPADAIARLTPVIPFLEAAFRHWWQLTRPARMTPSPDTSTNDAFQTFGGKLLSPRERQLAQLLLRGHSTVSIALQLGISATTVKTHRKNLYAKLGIATQFELFSRFLDWLDVCRRGAEYPPAGG